jgi:hypothetical protein
MSPLAVCKNNFTPFYTIPLFHLGNILLGPFVKFIGDGCHVFRDESVRECRK